MTTENTRTIDQIVGECAGAVSVCWENIAAAGVFDSTQAAKHVEAAVDEIRVYLLAENERLLALNDGLSKQIIGMSDRLQASARQIAADAWDKAVDSMVYPDGSKVEVAANTNPYRQPVETFGADV